MNKKVAARTRGRPATGIGEQVVVRIQPDLMKAVDRYGKEQTDSPTRAEVLRRIATDYFKRKGWL